jgi:hypothetical protein
MILAAGWASKGSNTTLATLLARTSGETPSATPWRRRRDAGGQPVVVNERLPDGQLAEDRSVESDNWLISAIWQISDYPELWRGRHSISRTICYQSFCVQLPPLYTDPVRRLQLVASPRLRKLQGAGRTGSLRQLGGTAPTTGSSVFLSRGATG